LSGKIIFLLNLPQKVSETLEILWEEYNSVGFSLIHDIVNISSFKEISMFSRFTQAIGEIIIISQEFSTISRATCHSSSSIPLAYITSISSILVSESSSFSSHIQKSFIKKA
jgi:hypothetical protein